VMATRNEKRMKKNSHFSLSFSVLRIQGVEG
jgi:hypothetical protein